ncbi:MAG: DUF2085 domain-containing protein [Anaerolineales bacterium]|nr:DUF2085 domain-containing protein [Anaerolineales bacterium]
MNTSPEADRKKIAWRWILIGLALALTITWLVLTPPGLLGKADAVGYAVCHQIAERSFHIHERPFPLCARCSGLFLGALLGLVYQAAQGRKGRMPPLEASVFFGLLALAWVLDGVNSFLMLVPSISSVYQTQNWTRLMTGTGMGLAMAAILLPAFIQTMFRHWEDQPALGSWKHILGLVVAAGVLVVLILLEIPWILYPLALLGAGGVVVLLVMVYSMALVMLFKRDNTYDRFSQLLVPLLGGFVLALLQIGAIDLVRYLLTGTWGGFSL